MTHVPPQARPSDGCSVPHFSPVRVRGGHPRLRRLSRHRRRALAVGLAMTAAALAATAPGTPTGRRGPPRQPSSRGAAVHGDGDRAGADRGQPRRGLLRPGDRVDVIAAEGPPGSGAKPRVVAAGVRVSEVPEQAAGAAESGALVVLSVPRDTASRLAGAGASARLAVTLR
ncbi:RcpC/CpaB family pilus assembly protein [Streptomyces sp. 135]|uniref:RcpC/CpaB family pilus assembly protein n=1 Tax=Streptomyces sp. 135 TaxID=2838850 RepID=UPI001CBE1C9A|nr:RcpC/CpaB family pilus assembly protein [Streptomyces sp. 135]